mgnify:CR=1 FL=1
MRTYLKELRKKAGLTQNDVSEKLGIGASTYTMIELGERQKDMSVSMAEKLANVFGVPLSYILENEKTLNNVQ